MARISNHDYSDDWAAGGIHRRDFRADHGSGPEEMPHRRSKKKSSPNRKGCPETGGAHVYVWIQFDGRHRVHRVRVIDGKRYLYAVWEPYTWYEYRCVGCDFQKNRLFGWSGRTTPSSVYEVRKVDYGPW